MTEIEAKRDHLLKLLNAAWALVDPKKPLFPMLDDLRKEIEEYGNTCADSPEQKAVAFIDELETEMRENWHRNTLVSQRQAIELVLARISDFKQQQGKEKGI